MVLPDCLNFEDAVDENPEEEYVDEDAAYDSWADDRVIQFYERLEDRAELYKMLIKLWEDQKTHTNNVNSRDELEKRLVKNLTGDEKHWVNMNSIHDEW